MIRRRAVAGLALLSGLLFCAFAAQSASAALTKSNNTTGYTCVKDASKTGDFKDAHCDETGTIGKEEYKHELIPVGTTTELDATNQKVTESTKKLEPIIIKGEVPGGGKVEIECTTMKTKTKNSAVHNVEPEAKNHTFTGNGAAEFSFCNVKLLKNCTVNEPIIAEATFHGVEGLVGPKGEKNAMGVEYVGEREKETFGAIEFLGAACSVKGTSFSVKGKAIGTSGPTTESAGENKESGATIVFTPKFAMQEMTLAGKAAEVSMITTPTGVGGPPVSITTTT